MNIIDNLKKNLNNQNTQRNANYIPKMIKRLNLINEAASQ
jgi:hypothetical protein